VKKRLARTIVGGFHGEDAAVSADENWARMFQQKAFSEVADEVRLRLVEFLPTGQSEMAEMHEEVLPSDFSGTGGAFSLLKIANVLTACGLTSSNAEAQRKLKEGAVRINDAVCNKPNMPLEGHHFTAAAPGLPRNEVRLQIRLGKKAKVVLLS
jgi:tyrosyl-tRNA synthetase